MRIGRMSTGVLAVGLILGWSAARGQDAPKAGAAQKDAGAESHGIAVQNIDRSVKPGDNFYLYANGEWIKKTEIPADRASIGVFSALDTISNKRTADLIEEAAKGTAPAGSSTRKIADLFNSYMDEAGIEAKGLTPLKPHLDAIAGIHDKKELAHALGETLRSDVDALNNTNFHTPNLVWVVGSARIQRFRTLHRVFAAGRSATAGPRVLPGGQRAHEEGAQRV